MKIVVCVEARPLGEATRAAIALAARARRPPMALIALSAGPSADASSLAEARRLGADRAVHLLDPSDGIDADALGRALAEATRRLGADLILAGARSDGEGRGVVPAAVAHHLGVAYVPYVDELSITADREVEVVLRAGGRKRRLAVPLPAVLTVGAASAPAAKAKPATESTVETLILDAPPRDAPPLRPYPLGTLERPKRKPAAAPNAAELVKHWLNGPTDPRR
jgi:electron transfer flavoprotein beta subunit